MIVPFTLENIRNGDVLSGYYDVQDNMLLDFRPYCTLSYIQSLMDRPNINPRFQIFVCNPDDTQKYKIPSEDIVLGGSASENYQNGQRRSLNFSLINETGKYTPKQGTDIWVDNKLALEIGLEVPELVGVVWFKWGIYTISNANPSHSLTQKTVSIEAADKFHILEGTMGTLQYTYEIPEESEIEEVIFDILNTQRGNGYVLDSAPIIYHPAFKGKKTPIKISGESGSTYGSILTQLADVLSAEIFYNAEGRLTIIPKLEMIQDGDKPVVYDFVDYNGDFQDANLSLDMSQFINKIVVIGSNVNGRLIMATAVNDDPSSPLSYQKIGYRIAIVNDTNITNDVNAQERADYELRKVLIAKSSLTSSVFFNPLLAVNTLVTYTEAFYGFERERLLIQSLSFNLDYTGTMSITASNIHNLPFVV